MDSRSSPPQIPQKRAATPRSNSGARQIRFEGTAATLVLLLQQPDLGDLAGSAVTAQAGFAMPSKCQCSRGGSAGRNIKFQWPVWTRFTDVGMDFGVVGLEPDLAPWAIACVNHADTVLRGGIESGVTELQRRVVDAFCMG